ncbi:MAG: HAD family hydrolase, partial [Treponema sp.]|nr:HAD family hydrolase [Treponema sp.]
MGSAPVRLLALDLDDTLLRSDLTISFHTRNVLKRAEKAGITVVLASGRFPPAMERFSVQLGLNKRHGYLICDNGAIIQETLSGKAVFEARLPPGAALIAYDLADAEGFPVQIYEGDLMYISRENEFTAYTRKLTGIKQAVLTDFRARIKEGCYRLLIPGDPMILRPLEGLFRSYIGDEVTLFTSKPYFLEILPPGI